MRTIAWKVRPEVACSWAVPPNESAFRGNVFLDGGVTLTLSGGHHSRSIRVGNNTFSRAKHWLDLSGTELVEDVVIYNNLVLGAEGISTQIPLAEVAKRWSFRNNWWEPGPGADPLLVRLVAEPQTNVGLASREPAAPRFLRPLPGSPLTRAVPAANCRSTWGPSRTWRKRSNPDTGFLTSYLPSRRSESRRTVFSRPFTAVWKGRPTAIHSCWGHTFREKQL